MTIGINAERAGLANICDAAVSAMPTYTTAGVSAPCQSSTPSASSVTALSAFAINIRRLRSMRSASVPPQSSAGICTTSCTTPMSPTSIAEPVSSSSHWDVPRMRIQPTMDPATMASHSSR